MTERCRDCEIRAAHYHKPVREISIDDVIVDGRKNTTVRSYEVGKSCGGVHLNVRRPDRLMVVAEDENGDKKKTLNPMRDAILHSDGCYDAAAIVAVRLG